LPYTVKIICFCKVNAFSYFDRFKIKLYCEALKDPSPALPLKAGLALKFPPALKGWNYLTQGISPGGKVSETLASPERAAYQIPNIS
jgi:hypothetical protein